MYWRVRDQSNIPRTVCENLIREHSHNLSNRVEAMRMNERVGFWLVYSVIRIPNGGELK